MRTRGIAAGDWSAIGDLEVAAYRDRGLSEGVEALRSRAGRSPSTCFVLADGEVIAGYLISLPYPRFRCPDLVTPERAGCRSDNVHLHDLVVAERFRGRGLARLLLDGFAAATARAYTHVSLAAVGGSDVFWAARGFRTVRGVTVPAGYGPGAVYMSKAIGTEST
ncbi:GNAT family N-acetyltransferase [Kutzneria buriramensis]|uniref:Ornithine decarboxylase n=1 Tax=Kutzneria buriramensis TaxID=1045776 RepID=A0A3E0GZ50_9PSEU|nr:GNAT family N-acetyltransferase [Kutzneria buriramensis]REH35673.1 ornithine decarboxylase [Kutzneria buriramensis]